MRGNRSIGRFGIGLSPDISGGRRGWLPAQYADALFALDGDGTLSGVPGAAYLSGNYYGSLAQVPNASITGGAGFATAVDAAGNVVGPFASNALPVTNSGAEIWEARTNLLRGSGPLSGNGWGQAGGSVTTNDAIAPDGTLTASRIVSTGGGGTYAPVITAAATTAHTFSVFVKVGSGNRVVLGFPQQFFGDTSGPRDAQFDPSTGVWSSVNAALTTGQEQLANGWWRIWIRAASGATPVSGVPITVYGTPAGHYFAWGAQLEAGSFPTPYIPTTTAAATRTALNASITGLASILTPPFTVYADAYLPSVDGVSRTILTLNDASSNNEILLTRNTSNQLAITATSGGVAQTGALAASGKTGARTIKSAVFVESDGYTGACDGVSGSKVSFTLPSSMSRLGIGRTAALSAFLNGQEKRLVILPGGSSSLIASLTA